MVFIKNISIENNEDKEKFYNKLFIYRSFLYYFCKFNLVENYTSDNIKIIIDALNIKKNRKRVTFIYDEAIKYVDSYYKDKNICGFKCRKCILQREKNLDLVNGCCRKCLYITENGCSTKNFACKMFNCSYVKKNYKTLDYSDVKLLKVLSFRRQILLKSTYFSKREDVIIDLVIGSLFIGCIRIFYRIIRNSIKKHII